MSSTLGKELTVEDDVWDRQDEEEEFLVKCIIKSFWKATEEKDHVKSAEAAYALAELGIPEYEQILGETRTKPGEKELLEKGRKKAEDTKRGVGAKKGKEKGTSSKRKAEDEGKSQEQKLLLARRRANFFEKRDKAKVRGYKNFSELYKSVENLALEDREKVIQERCRKDNDRWVGTGSAAHGGTDDENPEEHEPKGWLIDEITVKENAESIERVMKERKLNEREEFMMATKLLDEEIKADRKWKEWAEEKKVSRYWNRWNAEWTDTMVNVFGVVNTFQTLKEVHRMSETCKGLEHTTQEVRKNEKQNQQNEAEVNGIAEHLEPHLDEEGQPINGPGIGGGHGWPAEDVSEHGDNVWNDWSSSGYDSDNHYIPGRRREDRYQAGNPFYRHHHFGPWWYDDDDIW